MSHFSTHESRVPTDRIPGGLVFNSCSGNIFEIGCNVYNGKVFARYPNHPASLRLCSDVLRSVADFVEDLQDCPHEVVGMDEGRFCEESTARDGCGYTRVLGGAGCGSSGYSRFGWR